MRKRKVESGNSTYGLERAIRLLGDMYSDRDSSAGGWCKGLPDVAEVSFLMILSLFPVLRIGQRRFRPTGGSIRDIAFGGECVPQTRYRALEQVNPPAWLAGNRSPGAGANEGGLSRGQIIYDPNSTVLSDGTCRAG